MFRGIVISLVLLGVTLSLAGCGGSNTQSNQPIKATWLTPQIAGDVVSIPVSKVTEKKIVHFSVNIPNGEIAFMAYQLGKDVHVRSNICPPCRSIGFSLQKDTLVCDSCGTTFEAKTGDGISGGCVNFPKASVPYQIKDGSLIMKVNDLVSAYKDTLKPG